MKTERRHELQTNELADWLGNWMQKLAPYSRAITAGVIAVAALALFGFYMQSQAEQRQQTAWNDLFQVLGTSETGGLETVASQYSGEPAGLWSRLLLADTQLLNGIELMFNDRATATDRLRDARQSYLTVSNDARDPLMRQRAIFGLAQVNEALGERSDLDQAVANYQRLIDEWPDSALGEEAGRRIKDLKRESTKEFLDWFARQSPRPVRSDSILPGTPGEGPSFDESSLPAGPSTDGGGEFSSPFDSRFSPTAPDNSADGAAFDPLDAGDDADSPPGGENP